MLQRNIEKLLGRKPRRKTIMWIQDHLPDAKLPFTLAGPKRAVNLGVGLTSPLWPTFIAAAGAGAAFWWWTQWARGRAESEARENAAIAEGVAHPESVMAHSPEPALTTAHSAQPSDADLVEPAEALMAHAPPTAVSSAALAAGAGLDSPLSGAAGDAVEESLGVQGGTSKSRAPRKRKAEVAPTITH